MTAKEADAGVLGSLSTLETPFSINTVTRELMDKQQAAFAGDVLKNDPSVTVGNVAVPFLLLRGYTVGTDGTLFDGLPGHGGLSDGRAGLQAIDRVEVLKGASAFLYGVGAAGSLGGIVNYLPKRPTDAPLRSVGLGIANRSLFNAGADLGDRFGAERQFGYRVNLGLRDGTQAVQRYRWNQHTAALALDWRLKPGAVVELMVDHVDNHIPELPPFYIVAPELAVPRAPDASRSAAMSWDDFKTESDNVHLRADVALVAGWSITVQGLANRSGRPDTKQARFGSIDNAAGDVTLFGGQDVSSNATRSGQVLLQGDLATGPLTHKLSFGMSGSRQKSYGSSASTELFASNLYRPVDAAEPAGADLDSPLISRVASHGLLASDIMAFNEKWSLLLGVRRASLDVRNVGSPANKVDKTLPTVALMVKPAPGLLLYLNQTTGLEQGGSLSPTASTGFLPPRRTRQLELGAKFERAAVIYTAALFDMKRGLETFDAASGLNVQRGKQQHRGLELGASGRVTRALTIVGGAMLLNARQDGSGTRTDGKRAPGVPRLSANLWAEYRVDAVPGLALNAGIYHASKQYLDADNTQGVPGWTRLDLGASWQTSVAGVPTRWLLNVENAADRNYWASSHGGILTMADPLTVKLGLQVDL